MRVEAVAVAVGVGARTIERYEDGTIIPTTPALRLLAVELELDAAELEHLADAARSSRRRNHDGENGISAGGGGH